MLFVGNLLRQDQRDQDQAIEDLMVSIHDATINASLDKLHEVQEHTNEGHFLITLMNFIIKESPEKRSVLADPI